MKQAISELGGNMISGISRNIHPKMPTTIGMVPQNLTLVFNRHSISPPVIIAYRAGISGDFSVISEPGISDTQLKIVSNFSKTKPSVFS